MALDGSARGASDTSPEVDAVMFKLWRQATPLQKLQKVFGFGRMINALARSEIRSRYPGASDREVELRLASRNLPRELMIKAFGWDPLVHGL
jgi:hypothetical protein